MTSGREARGAVAVIPARYGSTRLPGKPLAPVAGQPLIQHVWQRVREARGITRVLVATDDRRILEAVEAFGGEALLTRGDHATGTDRIGEVLQILGEAPTIVNVQGDEPDLDPAHLDLLLEELDRDPELAAATPAAPWPAGVDPRDPARVKVVTDARGRALYFSRAPVPGSSPGAPEHAGRHLLHLGVYAFRRASLERFLALPRGVLEQVEGLEQLRLLENGMPVGVVQVPGAWGGIDTPGDLDAFRDRVEKGGRPTSPGCGPQPQRGG